MTTQVQKTIDPLLEELERADGFKKGYQRRKNIILLGRKLRQLRMEVLDISQKEAAELVGMKPAELSKIENGIGVQGPSWNTVTQIIEGYRAHLATSDTHTNISISFNVTEGGVEKQHLDLLMDLDDLNSAAQ